MAAQPNVFLESERLWFRPPEEADAERVAGWINDPRVRHFLHRAFPLSLEGEREAIRSRQGQPGGGTPEIVSFLFAPRGEEEPIGSTGLFGFDWPARVAEWGIVIDPAHWNHGYGREVARRLLRYAFEELGLHRVSLSVTAHNLGGLRAYEAAGFVREGAQRERAYVEGAWHDVVLMGVLRREWEAGR